jgi:hypothetical protein
MSREFIERKIQIEKKLKKKSNSLIAEKMYTP